jgi:hypothetical protein
VTPEERAAYRLEAMRVEQLELLGSLFNVVADDQVQEDPQRATTS